MDQVVRLKGVIRTYVNEDGLSILYMKKAYFRMWKNRIAKDLKALVMK